MSDGDDGAPERPANANMQQETPGRPKPPPPVPTAAKAPPPVRESNPFLLTPESSSNIDAGWLVLEDAPPSANIAPPAPPPPAPVATSNVEPVKPQSAGNAEVAFSVPPFKKKSKAKVIALMLLVVGGLVGGGLVYQSRMAARSASTERPAPETSAAPVETSMSTSEPAPPPTYTAEPPPSASVAKKKPTAGTGTPTAAVSADPATQAILDTTQLPPGRKIVVDGRMVGTSPRKVAVRCGTHRIVIGDLPPEAIAFPCGGEVNFTD